MRPKQKGKRSQLIHPPSQTGMPHPCWDPWIRGRAGRRRCSVFSRRNWSPWSVGAFRIACVISGGNREFGVCLDALAEREEGEDLTSSLLSHMIEKRLAALLWWFGLKQGTIGESEPHGFTHRTWGPCVGAAFEAHVAEARCGLQAENRPQANDPGEVKLVA